MKLIKRKTLIKMIDYSINLAVLTAFAFNMAVSQVAKADTSTESGVDETEIVDMRLPASGPRKPDAKVVGILTAYSSTVDQTDDDPFVAASGKRVHDGMIAANWLPFGTKVKIPQLFGDKVFVVEDRMNARYGHGRMDIWMNAPRQQVKAFGVKRATIEIYYD